MKFGIVENLTAAFTTISIMLYSSAGIILERQHCLRPVFFYLVFMT